jgi:uncharacterized protein (TIGR03437 family)
MRTLHSALAVVLSLSLLEARQEKLSCGTHPDRGREEMHLHKQSERRGVKRLRRIGLTSVAGERDAGGVTVRPDSGNIALLDDTDGVVSRRNPFNLHKRTLRFTPADAAASKYRFDLDVDTYDAAAASGGELITGLADDDSREVRLPFAFPFFGARYQSLFVNSDGNLTFGAGDAAITDRSLGRFTSGAPRIAALFRDLDPSRGRPGVLTYAAADRFTVSWVQVPEYRESGLGPLQTFQIRLFANGVIEYAFSEISTQEAVTGISPGRLQGSASVLSFVNTPSGEYTSSVAERFTGDEQIDIFSAAQRFYLNHDDAYDYLVIFNNLDIPVDQDAVAFEVTVRNNRSGYGDEKVDAGLEAGSKRRLQAILNMGPLRQYPRDPNAKVAARLTVGDTPLTTIAHEAGHLFLAFASIRDDEGFEERPMLGYQTAHWNFLFNSDASLLEGNRIQDNGPGASPRFLTTAAVEGFSALDQYLMGLRAPEEVPDMFLVTNARGSRTTGLPRVGSAFDGERRDIRIDEIVHAEGRRTPDHTVAQRRFRFAFILVTQAGTEPNADHLAQLEGYRQAFEAFYSKATSGRASADASLKKAVEVSTWPAAGVVLGSSATAAITLASPATTPLTVFLRPQNGSVETPSSVVIPASQTRATFTFTGRRLGTDDLVVEPADPQFETVHTRLQVSTPSQPRMSIVGGDLQTARAGTPLPQPVRVRVSDINEIPYPAVTLSAAPSAGGQVDRASTITDETGTATFQWTPGANLLNELRVSLPGTPDVIATALDRPALASNSVLNAASFTAGLAPGAIGTIFGYNLAGAGTVNVLLNGRSVPVFYSSTRQINFHVPLGTAAGTAEIVVRTGIGASTPVTVPVAAVAPGVFFDVPSGFGAITTAGTGQVTQLRPVAAGDTLEIYSTGLGEVETQPSGLRSTLARSQVTIGGLNAEVTFSGLAPGFTGLYQVNARVPGGLSSGAHPLVLITNGARSNEVRIQVR